MNNLGFPAQLQNDLNASIEWMMRKAHCHSFCRLHSSFTWCTTILPGSSGWPPRWPLFRSQSHPSPGWHTAGWWHISLLVRGEKATSVRVRISPAAFLHCLLLNCSAAITWSHHKGGALLRGPLVIYADDMTDNQPLATTLLLIITKCFHANNDTKSPGSSPPPLPASLQVPRAGKGEDLKLDLTPGLKLDRINPAAKSAEHHGGSCSQLALCTHTWLHRALCYWNLSIASPEGHSSQPRGAGPAHCSPCTSQAAQVYSNELETLKKSWQKNKRGLHMIGGDTAFAFVRCEVFYKHTFAKSDTREMLVWQWWRRARTKTHTSKAQTGFQVECLSQKLSIPIHLQHLSPS